MDSSEGNIEKDLRSPKQHPSFLGLLGISPSVKYVLEDEPMGLQSELTEGVRFKARLVPLLMSPSMQNGGCTAAKSCTSEIDIFPEPSGLESFNLEPLMPH